MSDGKSDVLIILDTIPEALFADEDEDSLAEQWMDNGNMLLWTGSMPFGSYVSTAGVVTDTDGAHKVLDVSSTNLCTGVGLQEPTSTMYFENFVGTISEISVDANGTLDIDGYVEYTASYGLHYDQLLLDALDSDWNHMSSWRIDEMFAEDSEGRSADNVVLVNNNKGQYAQFFTAAGMNETRESIITQILNNWVALPANILVVDPGEDGKYQTIQSAIDVAQPRDTVLVTEGTYHEMLDLKTGNVYGIKIVSDDANGGNDLLPGPGTADTDYGIPSKQVLRRASRTILDGTNGPLDKPMIDFAAGSTVGTVFDGFTVIHMPPADHTFPGHAHVVQTRGGSGTILNNIVANNGSSGLGSHASFRDFNPLDPNRPDISARDFRYQNILHGAHPILINNVVYGNEGTGMGNNHYSYAIMYNNEVFDTVSVGNHEAPGIGCQHGAHTLVVGNLVYRAAWVGLGGRKGDEQGTYPINRPTAIVMRNNRVYDSGVNDTSYLKPKDYSFRGAHGAGIGADDTGGYDPKTGQVQYHIIEENYVNGAANSAIGSRSIDSNYGYVRIRNNVAARGGQGGEGSGIGMDGVVADEVSGNTVHENNNAGISMRNNAQVTLIDNNESYENGEAGIGVSEGSEVGTISNNNVHDNGLVGIGVPATTVGTISNNTITANGTLGIALVDGATVNQVIGNTLSYNGTSGTAGMSIASGTHVALDNNTIEFSGAVNLTIIGPDTEVTMENTTLTNSGQVGIGPNLNVGGGAVVTVNNTIIHSSTGAPNINVADAETNLTISNASVGISDVPSLFASGDVTLTVLDSSFDQGGVGNATAGMLIQNAEVFFDGVTVSNSAHWVIFQNCHGSIANGLFFGNGAAGGGQLQLVDSSMEIIANIFHSPGGYLSQLEAIGTVANIYHNTFVGRANGTGAGPWCRGPGAGIHLDATSEANITNNIISSMPKGILIDAGSTATVDSTSYFQIFYEATQIGTNQFLDDPELAGDYSLLLTSPLIDVGALIPGVNDKYRGAGPDLGAVESF